MATATAALRRESSRVGFPRPPHPHLVHAVASRGAKGRYGQAGRGRGWSRPAAAATLDAAGGAGRRQRRSVIVHAGSGRSACVQRGEVANYTTPSPLIVPRVLERAGYPTQAAAGRLLLAAGNLPFTFADRVNKMPLELVRPHFISPPWPRTVSRGDMFGRSSDRTGGR